MRAFLAASFLLFATAPAHAIIVYFYVAHCGYMAPVDPETHWDGDDPAPYGTDGLIEGSTPAQWAGVSWTCDKSWASLSFGPDTLSGDPWKRKIYAHSTGPGYEDDAYCEVLLNGQMVRTYDIHLRF
jgi:hypothetical protein